MRLDEIRDNDIIIVEKNDILFPDSLRMISDCPERLYCLGDLRLLEKRSISIVGSRKTTQYGRQTARQISMRIAERGVCIVSGMAVGIDTCAHEGALKAGGDTIAVLGCGVDVCYPPVNEELKNRIEECGLLVSEYPPGTPVQKFRFPQRNRIISGLSDSIIIVQAGFRSGAMITAEKAIEQGRNVFAVPGNIDSQYNLGSNRLLRDGAEMVVNIGDLLDDLNLAPMAQNQLNELLSQSEQDVYMTLWEKGEMSIDELCLELEETPAKITKILTIMELKGVVFGELGKFFVAKS